MIIHIENEIIELENDFVKIEEIFQLINDDLGKKNLELDYLVIDNQPVYENFNTYFVENLSVIEKVEVVVKTRKKIIQDTIFATDQYLTNAVPQITVLAEEFYQQPNEKTWVKLSDLIEGIQWILEAVVKIDRIKGLDILVTHYSVWNEYVQAVSELSGGIPDIEVAMVNKDYVLIGDLLIYEISPIFEKMLSSLKFLNVQGENESVS